MKEKILSQHQVDMIWKNLISHDHKRFFAIARYTGQKFGLICNLKVSDVYDESGKPLPKIKFSGIKSGVHYSIVCTRLYELLRAYIPETFHPDDWLFPSKLRDGKPIQVRSTAKWLESASDRAGLFHLKVSSSCIRNAFIKHLYENGIDKEIIKDIIGIDKDSSLLIPSKLQRHASPEILDSLFG